MRKVKNSAIFLVILWNREAVATKKYFFLYWEGSNFTIGRPEPCFGGSAYGHLPRTLPLPHVCLSVCFSVCSDLEPKLLDGS